MLLSNFSVGTGASVNVPTGYTLVVILKYTGYRAVLVTFNSSTSLPVTVASGALYTLIAAYGAHVKL